MNWMRQKRWPAYAVGAGLGVLSWFAFATAGRLLGITTPFEEVAQGSWSVDWEWMLVLGVFLGAWLSSRWSGDRGTAAEIVPVLWAGRFGPSRGKRYAGAFLGGAVMMFGARVAQGCTSGHGISGALQFAVSSWMFLVVLFASGVLFSLALYGGEPRRHG